MIITSRRSPLHLFLNLVCQLHSVWLTSFVGAHTDHVGLHVVGAIICRGRLEILDELLLVELQVWPLATWVLHGLA